MIAAVIGCGRQTGTKEGFAIGYAHAAAWLAAQPHMQLVGVDISAENLHAFGRHFNLPRAQLFSSTDALYAALTPDYVSICTWPALHAPQTIEAAHHAVKGIVCEKPLALNQGEIRAMRMACETYQVKFAVGHQRRLVRQYKLAKQLLHQGVIGDNWIIEARVGDRWDILSWTTHWFDMVNHLFDATPSRLLAGMDVSDTRRYQHAVETASVVFAEYPQRRQAIFVTGPEFYHSMLTIRGSSGMLHVGDQSQTVEVINDHGRTSYTPEDAGPEGYTALMLELLAAVEHGDAMTCDVAACAAATDMAFAAQESARTMRMVTFPTDVQYAPLEVVQRKPQLVLPPGQVVLIADDHFGSGGREGIVQVFEDVGVIPVLIEAAQGLSADVLADAGLLMLYHTHSTPDATTQELLQHWVASGKPLLLIHAALGAYPQWDTFQHWIGRTWVWSGPEASTHPLMEARLHAHGDARWPYATAWLPQDEVYTNLRTVSACIDLVDYEIADGTAPAAWINGDHPHIGVWTPGHRRDMWQLPVMRDSLFAMIRIIAQDT